MTSRNLGLALVAGLATFLVVGATVTELILPVIEFSLFVGLPIGFIAGVCISAGVYLGLEDDTAPQRRRIALAVGGFGGIFLAVLLVAAGLLRLGTLTALGLGVLLGVVGATVLYVRTRNATTTATA